MKKWLTLCTPQALSFAFLLGFCSVGMQLLLTALSASFLGARVLHYGTNLTIFLAALGTGAIFSRRLGNIPILVINQWILYTLLSTSVPCLYFIAARGWPVLIVYYVFLVLIGGLFGFQVPQLFHSEFPRARNRRGAVPLLAATYLGGFLASFSFALLLYPRWGFFELSALFSMLTAGAALLILSVNQRRTLTGAISFALFLLSLGQLFTSNHLRVQMEALSITYGQKNP